jgi:uncharacterized membrane protein
MNPVRAQSVAELFKLTALRRWLLVFALFCVVVATVRAAAAAEFIRLGPQSSRAYGLSGDGSTVVGDDMNTDPEPHFRWTRDGGQVPIEMFDGYLNPSCCGQNAYELSADGSVLKALDFSGGGPHDGGVWTADTGWIFHPNDGPPSFVEVNLYGLSADGSTAVGRIDPPGAPPGEALRWTFAGGFEELGLLPGQAAATAYDVSADRSVIVGVSGSQLFRWTSEAGMIAIVDLPAGHDSWSIPIVSNDGQAVIAPGSLAGSNGMTHDLFRWTMQTGLVPIIPGLQRSNYIHTSHDGSVVVAAGDDGLKRWTEQAGLQTLPHLPGGSNLTVPVAMSADGSVVFGATGNDISQIVYGFWTADGLAKTLPQVLQDQGLGPAAAGWQFPFGGSNIGYFLSADGRVLAGSGINPEGIREAFVVYLDPLVVPEPTSAVMSVLAISCAAIRRRVIRQDPRPSSIDGWRAGAQR